MKRVLEHITEALAKNTEQDVCRLFHGRGQCYPGLGHVNVDWFSPVLLITLYQAVEPTEWQAFVEGLETIKGKAETVLVQRRYEKGAPTECLWGVVPDQPVAREEDLRFLLDFGAKQNSGFFLDMAPGRQWLRQRSQDKRILNLFSYTCAFSIVAIAGGAKTVVNLDMSKAALAVGRRNHQLNGQQNKLPRDIDFMPHDLFRSWKRVIQKGPYDIVIIDPPSHQRGSFIASKDYQKITRRLPQLLAEGGEVLACLNAPEIPEEFIHALFAEHFPNASFVERLANREDFPEHNAQRNLKMLVYRLLAAKEDDNR
jgi:23S rRNA (cytosine1962-C5)-methyltransferase